VIIFLSSFGLIEIYSIALGQGGSDLLNFKKQLVFVGLGVFSLLFFSFFDYRFLKNSSKYLYILGVGILVAVLFFGTTIRGTTGWFSLPGFSIQPVEFIKIILLFFLSYFFSIRGSKVRPLKDLLFSGLSVGIMIFLVLMQPDFGSASILLVLWSIYLFIVGFNKKYFIILGILFILLTSFLWAFYFKDYQRERILTFVNPGANSLNEGYNVTQAIIAVGAGGIMGRGIGFGSQSQLKFLPEAQNDFIFAVISEEFGFLGVFLVILFFGIFFYRCLISVSKMNDDFSIFFILGVVGLIFTEMFINISMNIGILPVVGISLPFISYGGSSVISNFILVGILENIIIKSKIKY